MESQLPKASSEQSPPPISSPQRKRSHSIDGNQDDERVAKRRSISPLPPSTLNDHFAQAYDAVQKISVSKDPVSKDSVSIVVAYGTGQNSLSIASKARKLGWKPIRETIFATIEETVKEL